MSNDASILERLNVLEKQNRRMKQIAAIAIVILASLLVMGQKAAANRTVEASEFVLRDGNGTVRSRWLVTPRGPILSLFDESGTDRITLQLTSTVPTIKLSGPSDRPKVAPGSAGESLGVQSGGLVLQGPTSSTGPQIWVIDAAGLINLRSENGYSALILDRGKHTDLMLGRFPTGRYADGRFVTADGPDEVSFNMFNDGGGSFKVDVSNNPSVEIRDKEGFQASLGSTNLITERTGEARTTSAASLTLFGKDRKILWKAP
jgi:hypothetical protein